MGYGDKYRADNPLSNEVWLYNDPEGTMVFGGPFATAERYVKAELAGHPLSCSIWKDAVCDCPQEPLPLKSEAGMYWHPTLLATEDSDVVASDTERPPSYHGRKCYWCPAPAEHIVHVDMPSCDSCKRRAVGRRSK